jgi:3-phenylpropionate/trans-cinnamate dioxygenase ferredoxin reductase component
MAGVVVVGAGMAGAQLVLALRQSGWEGEITLIGQEVHLPYQRPALSKDFLKAEEAERTLGARPARFYADKRIDIRLGIGATSIDRSEHSVSLADGSRVDYGHLVLATGSRNRRPWGAQTLDLRGLDDARALKETLSSGRRAVIVGAGFIGLELAAVARERDVAVTVIEALERPMVRSLSAIGAEVLTAAHRAHEVEFRFNTRVAALAGDRVELADGEVLEADVVVAGIGVEPNTDLAVEAGLDVDDGIVVDSRLLTSDPDISAIGDCTRFHCLVTGRALRLESVQNATDQARAVAARLTGKAEPYEAVPWFWTQQYGRRLQIAGVAEAGDGSLARGDASGSSFSVLRLRDGRLVSVESFDAVKDHMAARRLLAAGAPLVSVDLVRDPGIDLGDAVSTQESPA